MVTWFWISFQQKCYGSFVHERKAGGVSAGVNVSWWKDQRGYCIYSLWFDVIQALISKNGKGFNRKKVWKALTFSINFDSETVMIDKKHKYKSCILNPTLTGTILHLYLEKILFKQRL